MAEVCTRQLDEFNDDMLLPELVDIPVTRNARFESLVDLVDIYPNPATDYVLIELEMEKNQQGVFSLYSLDGALVKKEIFNSHFGPGLVEIADVVRGTYTYEILISEMTLKSGKLIVQ